MKPTKKQIEVLNIIKSHIDIMIDTNDITSPTHWSLIEDIQNEVSEYTNENDAECLKEALDTIYEVVRDIKI